MKIPIILKWIEEKDEWHLLTPTGAFLYNLYNCENMQKLFDSPDKTKREYYVMDVHRLKMNKTLQGETA